MTNYPDQIDMMAEDELREEFRSALEKIEEQKKKINKLNSDIQTMVEKAAKTHLPAYREQGEKLAAQEEKIGELENELYLCANLSGSVKWSEELLKHDKMVIKKMLKEIVPCCLEEIEEYSDNLKRREAWVEKDNKEFKIDFH